MCRPNAHISDSLQEREVSEQTFLYAGPAPPLTRHYLCSLTPTRHVDVTFRPCVNSEQKDAVGKGLKGSCGFLGSR